MLHVPGCLFTCFTLLSLGFSREKKEEASEDEDNLLEDNPSFQDDLSDLNYQPQSQRYPRLHTVCAGGKSPTVIATNWWKLNKCILQTCRESRVQQ